MSIRHALPADVDTLAEIEAASYPPAEGASRQSIAGRVAVYPDCFWLLDEGGEVKAFVNGFVTDIPQHQIEAIARCILPDILAFYESEEGQWEFSEWKKQREMEKQEAKTE